MEKGYRAERNRIWEIDFIRGLSILLMVLDHLLFDVHDIYSGVWALVPDRSNVFIGLETFATNVLTNDKKAIVHIFVVGLFLTVSGISSTFSRSGFRRAFKTILAALAITLVTGVIESSSRYNTTIIFGIIQLYAVCMSISAFIDWILIKKTKFKYKKLIRILVYLFFIISMLIADILINKYRPKGSAFSACFSDGFQANFNSADYFPIFKYAPMYFFGCIMSFIYNERRSIFPYLDYGFLEPINFFGRHALMVYLTHQIVIITILELLTRYVILGSWVIFAPN